MHAWNKQPRRSWALTRIGMYITGPKYKGPSNASNAFLTLQNVSQGIFLNTVTVMCRLRWYVWNGTAIQYEGALHSSRGCERTICTSIATTPRDAQDRMHMSVILLVVWNPGSLQGLRGKTKFSSYTHSIMVAVWSLHDLQNGRWGLCGMGNISVTSLSTAQSTCWHCDLGFLLLYVLEWKLLSRI